MSDCDNCKILIPSFEEENKTKSLNISIWGFVAVISMFTVGVGVCCFHLMVVAVANITSTIFSDNTTVLEIAPLCVFGVIFFIGCMVLCRSTMTAYAIFPDKIMKGTITLNALSDTDLKVPPTFLWNENKSLSDNVTRMRTWGQVQELIELICDNMDADFVKDNFFTGSYKRKEYNNPQLIKESKHFYIYRCGRKKLKIRKMYVNVDKAISSERTLQDIWKHLKRFLKRVLPRALAIFIIASAISFIDIGIGAAKSPDYNALIESSVAQIETELEKYGYEIKKNNNKCYYFSKRVAGQRTSSVNYTFGLDGSVENVSFEIYFDEVSEAMEQEIESILLSLNDGITEEQIGKFIQDTKTTMLESYTYSRIETDNYKITLGTSDGMAHIHSD